MDASITEICVRQDLPHQQNRTFIIIYDEDFLFARRLKFVCFCRPVMNSLPQNFCLSRPELIYPYESERLQNRRTKD